MLANTFKETKKCISTDSTEKMRLLTQDFSVISLYARGKEAELSAKFLGRKDREVTASKLTRIFGCQEFIFVKKSNG